MACSGQSIAASSARPIQERFSARNTSNWLRRSKGRANDSPPESIFGEPKNASGSTSLRFLDR